VQYVSRANPANYPGQTMSDEYLVELGGYVDPKVQIEAFFAAGKRLESGRAQMYDLPDGQYHGEEMDPTRAPNFDMADASMINNQAMEGIAQSKKAAKQAAEEAAKQAAEKVPASGE